MLWFIHKAMTIYIIECIVFGKSKWTLIDLSEWRNENNNYSQPFNNIIQFNKKKINNEARELKLRFSIKLSWKNIFFFASLIRSLSSRKLNCILQHGIKISRFPINITSNRIRVDINATQDSLTILIQFFFFTFQSIWFSFIFTFNSPLHCEFDH